MADFLLNLQYAFTDSPALLFFSITILGLTVGSFLNVVIYRKPVMMMMDWKVQAREILALPPEPPAAPLTLSTPRSRCGACRAPIAAKHNVPVLSWLLLGRRAACCGAPISARYPAVEIFTALISVACTLKFGASAQLLGALALSWTLIALAFIDLDTQYLPDDYNLPLLWAGLIAGYFGLFVPFTAAFWGAIVGYMSLWTVNWVFCRVTGRAVGMAEGDFKLLAVLGAWLGWELLPQVILLSSLVGSIIGGGMILFGKTQRETPIPFGPYLAAAGWLSLMLGNQIFRLLAP